MQFFVFVLFCFVFCVEVEEETTTLKNRWMTFCSNYGSNFNDNNSKIIKEAMTIMLAIVIKDDKKKVLSFLSSQLR